MYHHHHHHLLLNCKGRWGPTDNFATSFLHFSLFSASHWDLANSRPVQSLMLSSHLFLCESACLVFFPLSLCLARWFGKTWWTGNMTIPLQFVSLYDGQETFVWSDCLLDLGMDFLVGNMVFVWDAQYLAVASHFRGLYSPLELCCEGPWFTSIQEDGCDMGAHQLYLGPERNTPVIPNWFQPCECCCCLCYPGEYLQLGTLIRYNWAKVLEAYDSLKLLSIYFDVSVDATGVVCQQLGLLSTDLHAVGCGGFVEMLN